VNEVHSDGEIWSACLWKIREALGRERADKLVLTHHFLIRRDASFAEAAEALILADRELNGGANEAAIRNIFVSRGILQSPKRKKSGYDPFRLDNRPHGHRPNRKRGSFVRQFLSANGDCGPVPFQEQSGACGVQGRNSE
jgi:hypothetical protein